MTGVVSLNMRYTGTSHLAMIALASCLLLCICEATAQENDLQKRIQAQLDQSFPKAYPGVAVAIVFPNDQVFTAAALKVKR